MSEPFDKLQEIWKSERADEIGPVGSSAEMIARARLQQRKAVLLKSINVLILTLTFVGVGAFFYFVVDMQQTLSLLGQAMMLGSLAVRIVIEFISIYEGSRIDLSDNPVRANAAFLKFYGFRKELHGPFTITVLALYTIGFCMLIPEFSLYFSTTAMALIGLSYVIGAIVVGFSIRKGIRSEMAHLNEIQRLQKELQNEDLNLNAK